MRLLAGAGLLVAAVAVSAMGGDASSRAATAPAPFRVTLSRGACFGACPIYRVTIRGNGQVEWLGRRFVAVTGSARARVSRAAVTRLRRGVIDARVFRLKRRYDDGTITDLPSASVTVRIGERIKRVYHYHGDVHAPKRLFTLECLVDRIARTQRWVGRSTSSLCRQFQ